MPLPRNVVTTREEALEWLNQAGLFARPHDLWLGPAIAVSRQPREVDGIRVLDNNLIVHPAGDGTWLITRQQTYGGPTETRPYATLDEAVRAASALVLDGGSSEPVDFQ